MTHTMPSWLRRFFLQILPPFLWMQSPKLRENHFQYELSSVNYTEHSTVLENPHLRLDETTCDDESIRMNKVIFDQLLQVTKGSLQGRQIRSKSNASYASYINNKRRTSTILVKPISRSKHSHHQKENETFILTDKETRLIPMHSHHHRMQIETMRRELNEALNHIRYIAAHCAHEALIESVHDEWKFIATVMDRLQFVIFSTVTAIGSFGLLFQVRFK